MKSNGTRLSIAAALLIAFAGAAPALAKPPTAATTGSGTGCLVADANGVYSVDPECEYHFVERANANGETVLFSYNDHGQLPEGAPRPRSARRNDVTFTLADGTTCEGTEVTTPSGEYRSDCRFNAHGGH
jgi:hypothetical protein